MKTRIITTLLAAAFLAVATLPSNAQSTEQLFQKGIMKEEGEGNLQEAIGIFNSIVEDSEADDALQAKALLHVGLCYEKLGEKEASRAYQKLVDNYPAQKNEVAIARERLSRLILAAEKLAKKDEQEKTYALTNRKVWDDSDTYLTGHISPDGNYLSYVDWDTGDLALYEINTGKKRRLTNKGTWEESDAFAEYSVWLPDSEQIVYLWMNKEKKAEIRTIKIGDTTPRILFTNEGMNWAEIYDCSPDGKNVLLCFNRKDNNGELVTISTIDGSKETLRLFKSTWTHSAAFSPDSRFIVYDLPQENEAGKKDIYIMNLETKNESVLINHPEDDRVMGWLPARNDLLFISDRTGTPDFWRIEVEQGKFVGTAELVKSNKGPFPPLSLGFTDNGIFYYGERRNRVDVYEMEIDPLSGNIIEHPYKIVEKYIGCNGTPDYSEDGKFLAYVSRRPPGTMRFTTNPVGNVLCIRSLESGIEKEFRPDLNVFGFPKWAPDGQSVMVVNFDQRGVPKAPKGNLEYYQIDTNTGKAKPVLLNTGRNLFGGHCFSGDGRILYHGVQDEITKKYKLVARNLKKDTEIVLYEDDDHFTLAVSPDKQSLAILSEVDKSLKILPVKGGEPKELFNSEQAKDLRPETHSNMFTWSSDGKSIYFADQLSNEEGYGCQLYRISVKSGNITNLGLTSEGYFMCLNAHPDGRHFVYSAKGKSNSEVWMMENFLPPENLAQNNRSENETEGITIKQVWTGDDVDDMGQVSRDGRFLSYVDWETADLAIRNLRIGENKRLTHQGSWDEPYHYADVSLVTEDGKNIVYSWYNDDDNYELRKINIDIPVPETIYKPKNPEQIFPKLLYANDRKVLVKRFNPGKTWYLASVDINDGEIDNLKDFEGNFAINLSISPDKKFFAFDFPNEEDEGMFDIHLLSVDDKKEFPLVEHPANDRLLGWIPGTNKLLFASDRSGTTDVWAMNTARIPSVNEPERILTNVGNINPLGYTADGTLFYSTQFRRCNAYILPFNESSGKLEWDLKEPLLGSILDPLWTKNGESMIYAEREKLPGVGWNYQLTFYDVNTGNKRELATNINFQGPPSLSPDGKSVLIVGLDKTRQNEEHYNGGIFSVNILSGIATEIKVKEDISRSYCVEWDKEGRYIFYRSNNKIFKHNIASGDESEIYKEERFKSPRILKKSWDGNHLLFDVQVNDSLKDIKSIHVTGGISKILCSIKTSGTPIMFKKIDYSTDGKFMYLAVDGQENGSVLYRIPSEGGEPEKIWQTENRIAGLSIHPNENKMAISLYEGQVGIRKIENLKQEIEKIYAEKE